MKTSGLIEWSCNQRVGTTTLSCQPKAAHKSRSMLRIGAAMAEVHQAQKRVAKKRALHRRNRSTQNIIRASPTSSKPSIVSSSKSNASPRSPMWKKGTATASSLAKRVNKVPVQKKHRNANEKNSKIEKSSRKRATLTAASEEYQNLPFEVRMNRAEEKRRLNILRLKRQQWERHRAIMAPEERLNKPTQSSSVSTKTQTLDLAYF